MKRRIITLLLALCLVLSLAPAVAAATPNYQKVELPVTGYAITGDDDNPYAAVVGTLVCSAAVVKTGVMSGPGPGVALSLESPTGIANASRSVVIMKQGSTFRIKYSGAYAADEIYWGYFPEIANSFPLLMAKNYGPDCLLRLTDEVIDGDLEYDYTDLHPAFLGTMMWNLSPKKVLASNFMGGVDANVLQVKDWLHADTDGVSDWEWEHEGAYCTIQYALLFDELLLAVETEPGTGTVERVPAESPKPAEKPKRPPTPIKPAETAKPAETEKPAETVDLTPLTSTRSADRLLVDGEVQSPEVYKIGGYNYFKLRDLAALLLGSQRQFDMTYANHVVSITTGKAYVSAGGELSGAAAETAEAVPTNDVVYIDGVKQEITIYKINGNNYVRLRDLGQALDFYVGYENKQVSISGDRGYEA